MVWKAKLIEDLYEGTLEPLAWNRAIIGIADAVRASGAFLFSFDPGTGALVRDESHRIDPQVVTDYARYCTFEDIRRQYVLPLSIGHPQSDATLANPLKQSRTYKEFLLRVDLPHVMPACLHKSKHKFVALSLQGSCKRGPFDPQDVDTIRQLLPHLTRSLKIRDRLEAADIRAATFGSILDTTQFGVLVLNQEYTVLDANTVGSSMLGKRSGLWRETDGTLTPNGAGAALLAQLRAGTHPQAAADVLIHLPRAGRLPLSVLVLPLSRRTLSWFSSDPCWILFLFDPERELAVNEQIIAKDLGLSESESRVAALLASGLSPEQIARRLHVTIHTVRSQIKSAFQKTGCHTQTELMRRLLMGPALTQLRL